MGIITTPVGEYDLSKKSKNNVRLEESRNTLNIVLSFTQIGLFRVVHPRCPALFSLYNMKNYSFKLVFDHFSVYSSATLSVTYFTSIKIHNGFSKGLHANTGH